MVLFLLIFNTHLIIHKCVYLYQYKTFVYLTNNMEMPATQVALLYKYRWRVELFFYDKYIIMQSRYSRSDVKMLIACYFYANLA